MSSIYSYSYNYSLSSVLSMSCTRDLTCYSVMLSECSLSCTAESSYISYGISRGESENYTAILSSGIELCNSQKYSIDLARYCNLLANNVGE